MLTDTSSRATKSPKRLVTPRTSMLMAVARGRRRRRVGRCSGRCGAAVLDAMLRAWVSGSPLGPAQDRHDHDAEDRGRGQQERYGVRRALLEVLVLLLDDQRGGLRPADDVAGDDLHRTELA